MSFEFRDYSRMVIQKINETANAFLEEAGGELEAQAKQNTKVVTGRTKGSWEHIVSTDKKEVQIGSRYKNALWEELGTGKYALNGDGRKTGWVYFSPVDCKFHGTVGKKPRRMLYNAYNTKKNAIINEAQRRFKDL